MNPRVLFLDHAGVLSGAEFFLLDIVRHYAGKSKVLLYADGPFREQLERAGIAVEVLPAPRGVSGISRAGGKDLLAIPGVSKLAWRTARLARGYDVLYANSQKALVIGSLAGKLVGKPVIWHLHDVLASDNFSRRRRWLAVALANRLTARVVANSKTTAAAFVESGGYAQRVRVVYNGIDPAPFDSVVRAEVDTLRRELGLGRMPIVGSFSRLTPWKGQHVLLQAIALVPRLHTLLVGEALFGEHAYARALREQAKTLGIADRVHFLGFRRDIPQLMRLSDVVVHTSITPEPFGRMIVEGMLSRKPVVATQAGGAAEIIESGVSGILVPPGDAKALAAVLAGLSADASRRHAFGAAAYQTAVARFSLRAMVTEVEQQIREVASPRDFAQISSLPGSGI